MQGRRLFKATLLLHALARAQRHFQFHISLQKLRAIHALFNKRHARLALTKNKTMGIAPIDLSNFNSPMDYLATVKKKDYAGQARNRAYTVRRINRNHHIDENYQINMPSEARQGRPLEEQYLILQIEYDKDAPFQCFGVFNSAGKLCGYCIFNIWKF